MRMPRELSEATRKLIRDTAEAAKSGSNQYSFNENDNGVTSVYSADVMTEELQEESIGNRKVACVKVLEDGRIAVLDFNGYTIFVCNPRNLPPMAIVEINF